MTRQKDLQKGGKFAKYVKTKAQKALTKALAMVQSGVFTFDDAKAHAQAEALETQTANSDESGSESTYVDSSADV